MTTGTKAKDAQEAIIEDGPSTTRLLAFLQRASQVCETLLEENLRRLRRDGDEKDDTSDVDGSVFGGRGEWVEVYSSAGLKMEESKGSGVSQARPWDSVLPDRQVVDVIFNPYPSQPHALMTVHAPPTKPSVSKSSFLQGRTVIALWDSALLMVGRDMGPSKVSHTTRRGYKYLKDFLIIDFSSSYPDY